MELRAANLIDPEIEGHFAFFSFVEQISTREHRHDFFEIFLITRGSINHHINNTTVLLDGGSLVFIRPDDVHFYQPDGDQNCELINLAFLRETFSDLSGYLGLREKEASLVKSALPPMVKLTAPETAQISTRMKDWGRLIYHDGERSRLTLRALLAQLISTFFIVRVEDYPEDTPWWLVNLCQQMRQKTHVVEGREALIRLASRSPEHIGRVFKMYLGVTPSQFINNLRLDYASDLLLHTDQTVTDICFDVGFENLSYFYRLFKARWDCSPQQFRRANRRTVIP